MTTFPPDRPQWTARMRYFTDACLGHLRLLRGVLYHKGLPWLDHAITGVRTLLRAVADVGRSRGGARWVMLRVLVCLSRLEEVRSFACRVSVRLLIQARMDLRTIEAAVMAWSRQAKSEMGKVKSERRTAA